MALVAHAGGMRLAAPTPALSAALPARLSTTGPVMAMGRGSFLGGLRLRCPTPRFPGFGKRTGGISGCDGGDGGDGGEASPAPEESDGDENPFQAAWKQYEELLDAKPLLMKALTSFVGFALGDILAQKFIQKCDPFDWFRLFRLASFGFLVHGTTSHYFYGWLDGKIPGTSAKVVFSKVFIDQVLWNPCFGVMFFSYVALLEAKGISYVIDKTKTELLTQVTGSWKVWPLAHTINFRFIPSSQRVLYINTIQIGYNCFLSMISNRDA
eukprot:CAMPEP_0174719554 /NCGR_PEP_ID=MMETSP1094-20130205/31372_1 /TAXON_ID=156173 /ORGANISM="Chrysochromulina brevifilum, Strain UTEX LB 985" /LENGTH=267 /DNA_ID=CAMNT_0015919867 /DNA_START=79 /DNA_END=882 /DNA_ORIENTATION=-